MTPRNPSRGVGADAPNPRGPVRTCVGCRERGPRAVLVRLVVSDGTVAIDEHRSMPGRGAYLHPDPTCLEVAIRRRAIGRALRDPGADVSGLSREGIVTSPPTVERDEHPMSIR